MNPTCFALPFAWRLAACPVPIDGYVACSSCSSVCPNPTCLHQFFVLVRSFHFRRRDHKSFYKTFETHTHTMKFSASALALASSMLVSSVTAFSVHPTFGRLPLRLHEQVAEESTTVSSEVETPTKKSKKVKRAELMRSPQFYRNGFKEVRKEVEDTMQKQFKSSLVDTLKSNMYTIEKDGVRVHLAKDFGFCWGVERSIALAYEAVRHYPDRKVHITNELIHNPEVNDNLKEMKVNFIEKANDNKKDFTVVEDGDVVILPAFGASLEEMELLNARNVEVVDTTCPWVSKVWNTVDMHQRKGLTSVIHGKYGHEETIATTSFCEDYICVKDMKEAEMVADYIVNGGVKEAFLKYFSKAISKGFDPDTMLIKVGLANQTTMYKKETRAIGQLMQRAMLQRYGPTELNSHYVEFDTICDATQVMPHTSSFTNLFLSNAL